MARTYLQAARPPERQGLRASEPSPALAPYDPSAKSFDLAMAIGLGGGMPTTALGAVTAATGAVTRDSPAAEEFRRRMADEAKRAMTDRMLRIAALISPEKPYVALPATTAHEAADVRQDALGGDDRFANGRNFLATDEVPDTIFGIPVAKAEGEWTREDLAFFRKHPEAGGYYSMGGESPEDGSAEGAPVQDDLRKDDVRAAFMKNNPTLFEHVKHWEKLSLTPHRDIGGYAIGYGAHTDIDGNPVTTSTKALTGEAVAALLLARDLLLRRSRLAGLPNWNHIPGEARQALLDVSMGKDDILGEMTSKGLWADLRAAGRDPVRLRDAVKKHYTSYLTDDPVYRDGLMKRRVAGMKTFFGEDFSYEGKKWDSKKGWVME